MSVRSILSLALGTVLLLGLSSITQVVRAADEQEAIDWDRAKALFQRSQRGETLSAEDQAYLDKAKEARRGGKGPGGAPANAPPQGGGKMLTGESIGIVPLTDMKPTDKYKGRDGGLYGAGRNAPPEALLSKAMAESAKVVPLDASGSPAKDGRIVLMSIGMSNTTQEFSMFTQIADADASKSDRLTIVDGAQGGRDAADWNTAAGNAAPPQGRPNAANSPWDVAETRLRQQGVTPAQVQVIWIKQALKGPARLGEFPAHADKLQEHVESIIGLAKERYPNLKLVYLSSRIYAGYANGALNPEPYAFEGAFSMRGVIEKQLVRDAKAGESLDPKWTGPVVLWGPYLWADGTKGRAARDLTYAREDLAGDGTHPSNSGRTKVAKLLLEFFKSDRTAVTWFTGRPQ